MQALWKAAGRWGAVLLLSITVAGCALRDSPLLGDMDTSSALRVIEQPLVLRHLLTGELFAREAVELLAPNVGQWPIQIRQLVENGVMVDQGDAVVDFDNSTLAGNLDQQRTAVVTAETQLVSIRATSQANAPLNDNHQQRVEPGAVDLNVAFGLRRSTVVTLDIDKTPNVPILVAVPIEDEVFTLDLQPHSLRAES